MSKAINHQAEKAKIAGVAVTITTYQIADRFYCHIENQDPGATIARADGPNRENAKERALAKAEERLKNR